MNTLEQMTERFERLPEGVKEVVHTFDYDHRLHLVSKKFNLHIDQLVGLENLCADVIFGDIEPHTLTSELQKNLRLDREKAIDIALEINSTILLPLREGIKELGRD